MLSRFAFSALVFVALASSGIAAERAAFAKSTDAKHVDFERHVAGLLGKLGCSSGACHGSFQGRGGFRLSLFGHDPGKDFLAVTREAGGRRVDRLHPDSSLILLKPTGRIPHGGGKRLGPDSWQYRAIRDWIAQGCSRSAGSGTVKKLEILPQEHVFRGPNQTFALRVEAVFADGTHAEVTRYCDFRAKDDSIAEVHGGEPGCISAWSPGDTAIVASYLGNIATARVFVPYATRPEFVYPSVGEANLIDAEVFAKLRRLNIIPSELASDAEFLRRLTIDTIGCLPTPEQVRSFLADPSPDKRAREIDRLLAHPLHAALWATKFCDITACNIDVVDGPPELATKRAKMWHDWFRKRFAENRPYDEIAKGVITATSRGRLDLQSWLREEVKLDQAARYTLATRYADRPELDLYWRRLVGEDFFPIEQMAELTATAFLGVRIECAQCHKHPYDRWSQTDYRAFANVFSRVHFGSSPELTVAMVDLLDKRRHQPAAATEPPIPRLREIYVTDHRQRRLLSPDADGFLPAKTLGGPIIEQDEDPRQALFRWMAQPDNPYFAPSFVNRVWAHYFGIGIVEPVDSFSLANPPSNERLLNGLARDFVAHAYDIRRLERIILNSRTYQLSSVANETNSQDRANYSHAFARPLMAEVMVDVLNSALGTQEEQGPDMPPGSRAIEFAPNRAQSPHLARIFRTFGRPARTSTCDCERPREPAVTQALFLMTDPALLRKMTEGRLKKLMDESRANDEIIGDLFLATLCRWPDEKEKEAAQQQIKTAAGRREAFLDLLWALINTREFVLNH
jgi:hypothetical protein